MVLPALLFAVLPVAAIADLGPILITKEAQESDGAESSGNSFEIGDTAAGEFTGFREVLEKQQLQQAGSSLAEVVATESGVQFKQSGGFGTQTSVSLRGSSAEQVNVYLDGILLNEAAGGVVNFSDIELMQAEKVEVYKGTVPVQLGSTAIGGAINITTARAGDAPVPSLLVGVGSFGSARFSAAFNGPANWLNDQKLVGSISYRQSANDFPFVNDNGTEFNVLDDRSERRNNGQTRSLSGFLKTSHRIAANKLKLEHALQFYDRSQGVANWRNSDQGAAQLESKYLQWRSTARKESAPGGWSSLWELTGSTKGELFDDSNASIGLSTQVLDTDMSVLGARGYWEKIGDDRSLSFSLRVRSQSLTGQNRLLLTRATEAKRLRTDFSVQRNRYFNKGLSLLSASVTGFHVDDDYDIDVTDQLRDAYSSNAALPQIGVSHTINDRWMALGNVSLQKRVPSFFELFGSQGLFVGNSSLKDETSQNVDLGVKWSSGFSELSSSTASATVFYANRDDLIVRTYNARGIGKSQNLSRATVHGLELGFNKVWQTGFSVDANLTLQDTRNRSNIRGQVGKQLPGEAAVDGAVTTSWKNLRWKFEYEYKVNADRFYDSGNFLVAKDQRLHRISISRYLNDWRIDLDLNNLTDKIYEDYNGYPRPGRAAFVSVFYQPGNTKKPLSGSTN